MSMNQLGTAIREKRKAKGLLLRQLAAALDMDPAILSKIERGERKAKREQVFEFARLLDLKEEELLTLWLAEKIYEVVREEDLAANALRVAEEEVAYHKKSQKPEDDE